MLSKIKTPERKLFERDLRLLSLKGILSDADFTSVLAKCIQFQNAENQEYTNPEIESGLINYKFEKGNNCFDRLFNFNKELIKRLFQRRHSLEELEKSLDAVIQTLYPNQLRLQDFLNSIDNNPDRVQYFKKKGLTPKDARACALALSFYTGLPNANIHGEITERMNRNARFNHLGKDDGTSSDYLVIISFLYKALSHIPTYTGSCIRGVDLKDEEKYLYEPGSIVNWINFSSSSQGDQPAAPFNEKNTYFIISSINGRSIVQFSNFPGENEVLFHPCSTFIVVKKETRDDKTLIYLRQTELGMSDNTILWVDDKIFSENWEHKAFYDRLCGYAHQYGVRVIPKSSTAQAQSFLESPFGRENVRNSQSFQVITNMRRPNEKQGNKAGLNFANWLKEKKYNFGLVMFDSNVSVGDYAIIKNSIELEFYLQDKIKIHDLLLNCTIDDDYSFNPKDEGTPLPEENEADEIQTPNGEILIDSTPEAAEVLHHHNLITEAAEILQYHQTLMGENSTPAGFLNNSSMTPAGIDSSSYTPGLEDCSQEASKFPLVGGQVQQHFGGGHGSNSNNYNLLPSQ